MSKINFKIESFTFEGSNKIIINGQKLPPPSKRITLHQPNIRVLSAQIIYHHKKNDIEFEVSRINRVKSFGEVRLHTVSTLYPGSYTVTVEFSGNLDEDALKNLTL